MIFFVLGLLCTKEHVEKIRNIPHAIAAAILAAAVIPSVLLPYSFRNVRFTYESVGLSPAQGIGYRALFYLIAILMIGALINLFPDRKNIFSQVGTNAILVYAGSSFAAPALYLLIAKFCRLPAVSGETWPVCRSLQQCWYYSARWNGSENYMIL